MLQTIAEQGSFAAAARALGMVPSALTYRVRQLEDGLDVLLFDRSARQARPTAAGRELLREAERLLHELDAVANRVRRVATGWEAVLTVAVDGVVAREPLMDLCADFLALQAPTRLRLRHENLSGTLAALTSGQADLALGVLIEPGMRHELQQQPMGDVRFVYAVAPQHPLAHMPEPLTERQLQQHRAVAVADSVVRGQGMTVGLMGGQEVFTVPDLASKLSAQLRGLGGGFLPESVARPWIASGQLVERQVAKPRVEHARYLWREGRDAPPGKALRWWLDRLAKPRTRRALLQHPQPV